MGTFSRVPIIRTIVFWGLYWGPPILGNYHIRLRGLSLRFRISGLGLGSWDIAPNTTENHMENMKKNDLKDRKVQEFTGRIHHPFLVIASPSPPPL